MESCSKTITSNFHAATSASDQIRYPLYITIHKTTTCIHIYQNSQIAMFPTPNPLKPPPLTSLSYPHPSIQHSPHPTPQSTPSHPSIPPIHQSPTPTAHPPNFQNYIHTSRQLAVHKPERAALFPSPAPSVAAVAQCLASSSSSSSSQHATRTANESFSGHTSCVRLYPTRPIDPPRRRKPLLGRS